MHHILRVTWQVAPLHCPPVRRHCSSCKSPMPFVCSMKFRANAQKKRIDVWLIYRCSACDGTWNLPVFERAAINDLAPDTLHAIMRNDPALARRYAFDHARLARHGAKAEDSSGITLRKSLQNGCAEHAALVEIDLALELPCEMRLDRLLSSELGISRSQLHLLHGGGALQVSPAARNPLRTPISDGQRVSIDLGNGALTPDLAMAVRRSATD